MDVRKELTGFLLSRRARLQPEMAGVPSYGQRRRVPGLRREELAQLAGVSVTHYTRLEQGNSRNVSAAVLDAVAGALQLTDDEHEHLTNLVHPPRLDTRPDGDKVRTDLLCLIEGMPRIPAIVHGRHGNILAWNEPAERFLGDLGAVAPPLRSWPRLVFTDESFRSRLDDPDWERLARQQVAYLRLCLGRFSRDAELAAGILSLHSSSAAFRQLWDEYLVMDWHGVRCRLRDPVAGDLDVVIEVMQRGGKPDQWLVTFTPEPERNGSATG